MAYNPGEPGANAYPPQTAMNYSDPHPIYDESTIPPAPVPPSALAAQQQITGEVPAQVNFNQPQSYQPSMSLLLLIGLAALVVIVAAGLYFLNAGKNGLGVLPAYANAKAITLTDAQHDQIVMSISRRFGGGATGVDAALFSSNDDVRQVVQFYNQQMTAKKYSCTPAAASADYNTLNCQKDSDAALVYAAKVRGADFDTAPELTGKIEKDQTLIVLIVGSKPDLSATPSGTAK